MQREINEKRLAEFKRRNPLAMQDWGPLPATILGVGDREICLLDANAADLRHYMAFLERRIARRRRLARSR